MASPQSSLDEDVVYQYPICQTLSNKLSRSHYCELLTAEYALGGLSNQIFASKYTLCLPNKEQLIAEVERMLARSAMNS